MFAVTLALTLTVPLQWAIIGGAVLSLITFVIASASQGDLQVATRDDAGWMLSEDIPQTLSPDEPVVVRHTGPNFFADVSALAERLPAPDPKRPGVLVVDVGALQQLSSTALKQVAKYHDKLAAAGSGLVLAGIGDRAREVLAQTGLLGKLGEQNVLPPDPHLGATLDAGLQRGRELLSELQANDLRDAGGRAWPVVGRTMSVRRARSRASSDRHGHKRALDHHKQEALT